MSEAAWPATLAFARLAPLALWAGRTGGWLFPGALAWSACAALALYFGALAAPAPVPPLPALSAALARELGLGACLCFAVAAPFSAVAWVQRALGRAVGGPVGELVPRLLALASGALLLRLSLDRALLRVLASSFAALPAGKSLSAAASLEALFVLLGHGARLALSLLLPFLAALFLVDAVAALAQRWFVREPSQVADLPLRALGLGLVLASLLASFADRVPGFLRGALALVGPLLARITR